MGKFFRSPAGQPFDRVQIVLEYLFDQHDAELVGEYGEPRYTDPENGILFADWNNVPKWQQDLMEEAGYELEWSDEWVSHNNKAYRCSPRQLRVGA